MCVAASECHDGAVHTARGDEGLDVGEQRFTQLSFIERNRSHAQLANEHRPQVRTVGPPRSQIQHRGCVKAGAIDVARPRVEASGNGVGVHRRAGPVRDGLVGKRLQLVGDTAGTHQLQPLRHADVARVGLTDASTQGRRRVDPLCGNLEVAVQQRP